MHWKDAAKSSVGADWGSAPSLVEGINARINLPLAPGARAWALDAQGRRQTEVPLKRDNDRTQFDLSSQHHTLWWEIAAP
jgi:hypothetical protein